MSNTATAIVSTAVKGDVAHKIAQTGAGASVIFGLTLNEWGVIAGVIVAVGGFAMQWYYRRKEFRLKELYYAKHGIQDATEGEPS